MNDVAIKVENLSKTFKLPHQQSNTLKHRFVNFGQRPTYEYQEALKDVSLEIKKGDFFGIVGRNGSGKSTLLKCLAGVYAPTAGTVQINGKLTPFIELGVGFNPELSGRDNVFLNGALLGFSRQEMAALYDQIVEFAELERFMDQKLKNYSSGMQVRLAFAISINVQSDILLVDEVLAVGDASFQRKCTDYFQQLKKSDTTVVLVTHDMNAVQQYCNRAIMLQDGVISREQSVSATTDAYTAVNLKPAQKVQREDIEDAGNKALVIKQVKLATEDQQVIRASDENVTFHLELEAKKPVPKGAVIGMVIGRGGETVVWSNSRWSSKVSLPPLKPGQKFSAQVTVQNIFPQGIYNVQFAVLNPKLPQTYDRIIINELFSIVSSQKNAWTFQPDITFKLNSQKKQ